MPCSTPLKGWRTPSGSITFRQREGYWDLPPAEVPCGQCIECKLERSRQWAVRCVHESKMHKQNCFLTLTYSEEKIPPHGTLRVEDWQDFAKRLRHKMGPFRFFHCGEYGEHTSRPHYHALIFGLDFHSTRKLFKYSGEHPLYRSELLDKLWGHGYVNIGELTHASAAYCASYTTKKITGQMAEYEYMRIDYSTGEVIELKHPYCTMSRRPGIGKPWLDKFKSDVYMSDEVISNGHKAKPPKYYDNQLCPTALAIIKSRRKKKGEDPKTRKDQSPKRLAVRHKIVVERQRKYQRNKIEPKHC